AVTSHYSLGVNYSLSAASFLDPKQQWANRDATEATIIGQAETMRASVTSAYLDALAAQASAALQDTLVITAQGQLDLANAKVAVGQGTILDQRTAEVALGQAQIAALTAHNTAEVNKVTLFEQIGIPEPAGVQLTTAFSNDLPNFDLDSLQRVASVRNPTIESLRASARAASLGVRTAQSHYTPTLSLSTGWGGNSYQYTNSDYLVNVAQASALQGFNSCVQQDSVRTRVGLQGFPCGSPTIPPAELDAIRSSNNVFPFKFTRSPLSLNATISLPIFDGFNREQSVEQAIAGKDAAEYRLKAQQLQTTTQVTQAYLNLQLAEKTIGLRQQNAQQAREEYQYAQDRYRVGQATFLDVTTAHGTFVQAQVDRLNSVYDYQKAFVALESAVGRPLR
ncbi:MAG TPA: TolC family protein, partial [Gemmatimonadaceae bacterium]